MVFTSEHKIFIIESNLGNSVFNNEEWTYSSAVACLAEFRQKFPNLNRNRYMQPQILPCIPEYLWLNLKAFFNLNYC
jgi:hypothetical protein